MNINTPHRTIRGPIDLSHNALHEGIAGMELAVANTIPLTWSRARDFSVFDDRGNRWIDFTSGIFVANAGHANPAIKKALQRQLDEDLLFAYNYPTAIKQRLLRKLLDLSPSHFDRVALLMTGSETVDLAYKLVKFWARRQGRKYIVVFKGSYHGRGLSCDLICGRSDKADWSGLTDPDVVFLEFPYQPGAFDPSKLPPKEQIAAFFLETFQGWGAWFYPPEFISPLVRFAREAGALLCFDEMQAGFYRMGPLYGYQTYGEDIRPDILCLGKGITSSLPLAAVLSRKEIVDLEPTADLHGTHSGNSLCCAAALANLEFLSDPAFQADLQKRIRVFEEGMRSLAAEPLVQQVNVRGMIAGLILPTAGEATAVVKACIQRGVLPVCTNKPSIKLAPPLTITEDAIRESVEVIQEVLRLAKAGKLPA